jgi:hypothetical protein
MHFCCSAAAVKNLTYTQTTANTDSLLYSNLKNALLLPQQRIILLALDTCLIHHMR